MAATGSGPLVVVMQRSVLQYRVAFFEQLRAALGQRGIRLALVRSGPRMGYDRADQAELPWMVDRPARSVRLRGRELLWQPIGRELGSADLVIVEQATRLISNLALLSRPGGPQVALWGHGRSFDAPDRRSRVGEWAKRSLLPDPDWWFAYNDLAADVVRETGFPAERLTVVNNSTDTRQLQKRMRTIGRVRQEQFRREHDLGDGPIALFVGNLSPAKRLDFLLASADLLAASIDGFRLLIVGDGECRSLVHSAARERSHVRGLGQLAGDELAEALAVAKVLLVPGWAGLIVVDSFAAGVPLCASGSMDHPPEVSYIEHGVSGLMIDDFGEPERYASAVAAVLRDEQLHDRLVAGCAAAAERYTVEGMVERFVDGIQRALEQGRTH